MKVQSYSKYICCDAGQTVPTNHKPDKSATFKWHRLGQKQTNTCRLQSGYFWCRQEKSKQIGV